MKGGSLPLLQECEGMLVSHSGPTHNFPQTTVGANRTCMLSGSSQTPRVAKQMKTELLLKTLNLWSGPSLWSPVKQILTQRGHPEGRSIW